VKILARLKRIAAVSLLGWVLSGTAISAAEAPGGAMDVAPSQATSRTAVSPAPASHAPMLAARSALPRKGRVRYALMRGEDGFVVGQVVHTWDHDGRNYKAQSVAETTGLAALLKPARTLQSSLGEVTAAGLRPHEFRHERAKGTDTASFDWARRTVGYDGHEDPIVAGTQDMLSMYYQLVLLGAKAGNADMPIATGRKLESYRFDVVGEETVALAGSKHRALHLKSRSSGDDVTEVWIAPDVRGLPVKIRFTDRKGQVFDQVAQEISIGDAR
jgi:hypothetical protein